MLPGQLCLPPAMQQELRVGDASWLEVTRLKPSLVTLLGHGSAILSCSGEAAAPQREGAAGFGRNNWVSQDFVQQQQRHPRPASVQKRGTGRQSC